MSTGKIEKVNIIETFRNRFNDYATSVNVSRAIPDVRDGLKPVHRRILHAMNDLGMTHGSSYKKSARVVGEVIGKYHPHGDSAVYESMVRMAQEWNLRYQLVDGHGNFGDMDGNSAAAMRYTEVKLKKIAGELLRDIKKETVDFQENYDGSESEPKVLPGRFPNLLVNGTQGIAVGMASSIPTHNLNEICQAVIAQIENPDISIEDLMNYVKGPDFPTGAIVMGEERIKEAYRTGRGTVRMRAKTHIEEDGKHTYLVITELPYQVNKQNIIEKLNEIQKKWNFFDSERKKAKKNSQVKEEGHNFAEKINDETDRENENNTVRIVITLKREANPDTTLKYLFKNTQLQETCSFNMNVNVPYEDDGKVYLRQRVLNLKEMIHEYIKHQKEVETRRVKYDLKKLRSEIYHLEALIKALNKLDETIQTIRDAETEEVAVENLMALLDIEKDQAEAILLRRLRTIANFQQDKVRNEYEEKRKQIEELEDILADEEKIMLIVKENLITIMEKYGDERRTEILPEVDEINLEDTIVNEQCVVTMTHQGYIKRTSSDAYRAQRRKGRGVNGMVTYDDDFIHHLQIVNTHDTLLFFTNYGRVYQMKAWEIRDSIARTIGVSIKTLLNLQDDENVQAIRAVQEFSDKQYLFFGTRNGMVVRSPLSDYQHINKNGIKAMNLREGDRLIDVALTSGNRLVTIVTQKGLSITFDEDQINTVRRGGTGVKGIKLSTDDKVVSFTTNEKDSEFDLFIATNNGFGKRTPQSEFRVQKRGGKGIFCVKLTEKNGLVVGTKVVDNEDALMLITKNGLLMKLNVDEISQFGRNTQGTKIINLKDNDELQAVERIVDTEEDE